MSLLRNLSHGLRSLFRKERVEHELDEELNGFLELAAEEKMQQGMSRKDALRAVRLERGSLELTKKSSALLAGNVLLRRCGRICASPHECSANLPRSLPSRSLR
jgi:hypothetical protein